MIPKVSIIIPVFNRLDLTQQCLKAIEKNTPHDLIEVIIIDNGSNDGTTEFFQDWKGLFELRYLRNNENLGYAKANNQGASVARGEYLILLNNDTEPQMNWMDELYGVYKDYPNVGAVGAKLLFPNGTIQHIGVVTVDNRLHNSTILPIHIGYEEADSAKLKDVVKFNVVTGACLMIPTEIYKKVGGLDESYWNGYEDVDLCFKTLEAGLENYCQHRSVVIHHESQSGPQRWVAKNANLLHLTRRWGDEITCQYVMNEIGSCVLNDGVTVVIVTHNSGDSIKCCIENLNKTLRKHDEIVIVDDASTDTTIATIKDIIALEIQINLICNQSSIGFAKSANLGASEGNNPYIVFLNPCATLQSDWLRQPTIHFTAHKKAIISFFSKKNIHNKDSNFIHSENGPHKLCHQGLKEKQSQNLWLLPEDCVIVKRKLFCLIGGMDEKSTLGNEILDMSKRLCQAGYECVETENLIDGHQIDEHIYTEEVCLKDHMSKVEPKYPLYGKVDHCELKKAPEQVKKLDIEEMQSASISEQDELLTSIIIVTFNQLEYTRQCIRSIFTHTHSPFEIIIIDNGSTDGTIDFINTFIPSKKICCRFKLISNSNNLGFAKGCNLGLSEARGEYLLLLNNDVVVTPSWLPRLLRVMDKNPRIGLSGPMTNYVSGRQIVDAPDYNIKSLDGLEKFAQKFADQHKGQIELAKRIVGFCMLIRRCVVEKIGGLDERYGLGNFEDDDYCLRAHLAGYHAAIARDCYIHHFGGRTFLGNKINYGHKLEENWKIFKKKWEIPIETPISNGYMVPHSQGMFDEEKHFVFLEPSQKESAIIPITKKQSVSVKKIDEEDSSVHPLSFQSLIEQNRNEKLSGGCFMSLYDQIFEITQNSISSEEKQVAVWILECLIEKFPENAKAYHELGLLLFEIGRIEEAFINLEQAFKLNHTNALFGKDYADFLHVVKHDDAEALKIYEHICEFQPDNLDILLTLGHLNLSKRKYDKAQYYYKRVLEIDPENIEVRGYIDKLNVQIEGKCNFPSVAELPSNVKNETKTTDSTETVSDLSEMDEKLALYHNDQGVIAYQQGKKENAFNHYIKAVTLEPNNLVYQKNLADFYWIERNDAKSAMERYVQVLTHAPLDVEALMACGHICLSLGKSSDAREFFENVIQTEPWNERAQQMMERIEPDLNINVPLMNREVLYQSAQDKVEENDFDGAICDLNLLINNFPDDAIAYNDLGVVHFRNGNKEEALYFYEKAIELSPDQDIFKKNLADFYFFEQGRAEDAMKLYVNVLENSPQDVECLLSIGVVCKILNKKTDAREFFQQVLEIEPWNSSALQAIEQIDNLCELPPEKSLKDSFLLESKKAFG